MLRALIIDDELPARESLAFLVRQYCPEIEIVGLVGSALAARAFLMDDDIDLLFLDISMPNEDGFDLLLSLPSERYSVVFVTAYNQYALRAIKANALDYILKPVDIEELKASVQKVLKIHAAKATDGETRETYQATLNHTYQTLREPEQTITKLTLPQSHGLTIVNTVDIIYLEADSNYTVFFMRDGKRLVVAKTLKEFEEILDERTFVRIHKSSILHLAYLKTFSALNSNATTTTGDVLAVSRRRWAEFTERVSAYSTRV